MAKQPYIPLYIGDWEQDTNMLSLEAEGGWLKIIFKMFKGDKTGVYKISAKGLQNLWRKNIHEIETIIDELFHAKVCGVERLEGFYVFTNRRLCREHKLSKIRAKAAQNRSKTSHPLEYDNEYDNKKIDTKESSNDTVPKETNIKKLRVVKPKKNLNAEPYWKELVKVYYSFCFEKFNEKPTFDGSAPHDMHRIIEVLKQRAIEAKVEWTEHVAKERWRGFLGVAFQDKWLSENWLLSNINSKKDKIFFNKNGTHKQFPSSGNGKEGTSEARTRVASNW